MGLKSLFSQAQAPRDEAVSQKTVADVLAQKTEALPPKEKKKVQKAVKKVVAPLAKPDVDELSLDDVALKADDEAKKIAAKDPGKMSAGQIVTLGLMNTLPALLGKVFAGDEGAAEAAGAGLTASKDMLDLAKSEAELASKKDLAAADKKDPNDLLLKLKQLDLRERELAQRGELGKAQMGLREKLASANLDARRAAREEAEGRQKGARVAKSAESLAKQLEASGLPELQAQLGRINAILPPPGKDIPGYGRLASLAPDVLTSKQGVELRQEVAGLRNAILKARSGAAITPQEAERLLQEIGEGALRSEDQLRRGIRNVQEMLGAKVQNIRAGAVPEAVEAYTERGGALFREQQPAAPVALPADKKARLEELRRKKAGL